MSSAAAVTPKSWQYAAGAGSLIASYLLYKDGGFASPKVATGVPAQVKTSSTAASYANLSVDVQKDGSFKISYDVDGGASRSTQIFEKSGKPLGDAVVEPVVVPAPPAPVISAEVQAIIDSLEASLTASNGKILELTSSLANAQSATEAVTKALEEAKAAAQAKNAPPPAPAPVEHSYKVSYFPIRGLGDPIRVLLHDNNVEFVDNQVAGEAWNELKPTLHFKQVPALFDNGFQVVQSGAILRYLGNQLGLSGNTAEEKARVDYIYEGVVETRKSYYEVIYQAWDKKDTYVASLPTQLANLEALYAGHEFAVGNKPTYADYALYSFLDSLVILSPNALNELTNLKALHARMHSRPNIQAYTVVSRPTQLNGNGKQ